MSASNAVLDWWPIITAAAFAAAVYGGIRADLRQMRKDIDHDRDRIDSHLVMHAAATQAPPR